MKDARIQRISVYKISIPLIQPFVISLGPVHHAHNIIVVIETTDGLSGTGECSPFPTINGETQDTCFQVAQYLAKGLKAAGSTGIQPAHEIMDRIIYGNTSIKSAFDIALYDLAARGEGVPLYQYLGGRKGKEIISDYTISIGAPAQMAAHALELKEKGFKIIKVKVGHDPLEDIERIAAIRKIVGGQISLRIDANQGWSLQDAVIALNGMSGFNIQYCEEPIARWNWQQLPLLRSQSPIKIMADESCFDEHDAQRLIAAGACDLFNLKLGKSSGFFRAMKIIDLAAAAGLKMQVGGFMESRLGVTANYHLALASDDILFFDLDTPLMLSEDFVSGGISYGPHADVSMDDAPGLGAWVDAAVLERLDAECKMSFV